MISLCKDKECITDALAKVNGSVFIRENIRLYLEAYGTDYEFSQLYLQYNDCDITAVTSIVLRYNNLVYVLSDESADINELFAFVCGFADADVFADEILKSSFSDYDICYTFSKNGETVTALPDIKIVESAKIVSDLVTKDYDEQLKLDFFLNTAHQIRHGILKVYGYYLENQLAAVVSASDVCNDLVVITFVYTDSHFRGNGLASHLLSNVCCDAAKKYILLCEEHNVKFYEKCGFNQLERCVKFKL